MSSQRLEIIKIEGFKSIRKQSIALEKMNVLIGQNGAGKSNFISLFRFLRIIISKGLETYSKKYGAESLLYYGSKETEQLRIYLDFSPNCYEVILQPSIKGDNLFIESEKAGFWGEGYASPYWGYNIYNEDESQLSDVAQTKGISRYVYDALRSWRVYHFHDTSESAGLKKYAKMTDSRFLFEDAANIAPFLYVMRYTYEEHYARIVKTIRLVIPFFKDFLLEPNPLNPENIRLEWNDIYSEKTFTANELSDGSLRFICMAVLLLQSQLPDVILLDEPELGLHPSAITILAGLLRKASTRSQVIVSTQSVSLVNEFEAEDIIVVEKKEAETTFKRLDAEKLESWLENYSLGDLWDKNIIGGKP